MKKFITYIFENKNKDAFTVEMHLHHKHPPIIDIFRKAIKEEDDHIAGALYKDLGEFKPSSLDHDTITNEYHHHLFKHGYYSTAPSHPMVLSPKQYKFKDEFKRRTTRSGMVKHQIPHHDYGAGRFKNYHNPHIGVWSSRSPTHIFHNSGERIPEASKDSHSVIFHDSRVKHQASTDSNRWFLHSTDVAKIPEHGLVDSHGKNYGHDIHAYVASRKPAQSKLRRDVLDFHKKEFGSPKHHEVMNWIKKEHPEFHPDVLKSNVSGKIS